MRQSIFALAALSAVVLSGDTPCACDVSKPETMTKRECSLCVEAERHPAGVAIFFVKDINPRKPNRTLALPRAHTSGLHPLAELPPDQRTQFWTAAIDKAKSLWGNDWAVAYNGDRVRTQCHAHVHIGRLLPGVEAGTFLTVSSPAEIPPPKDEGYWIHSTPDSKMHVHTGEQITETVLLR